MNTSRTITILITIAAMLMASSGCSNPTAPESEQVSSLRLTAPALIAAGQTVPLTIEAVGSNGTTPFTSFNGDVALTVSSGSITPNSATLVSGRVTLDVTLSAPSGIVRLSGAGTGAAGAVSIDISALIELPGNPGDPAVDAMPALDFIARPEDYLRNDNLSGLETSFNTIGLIFENGTTVGEANTLLSTFDALIVGTMTAPDFGLIILRTEALTHTQLDQLLVTLRADPIVAVVARDILMHSTMQPSPEGTRPPGWVWGDTPGDGNWGMEMTRVPQMWNFNGAIEKLGAVDIGVGIYDRGFTDHDDLVFQRNFTPAMEDTHGTHVAGIIAAGFSNKQGVDGVIPYALLNVFGTNDLSQFMQIGGIGALVGEGARVINLSMGFKFTSHPNNNPQLPALMAIFAEIFSRTLEKIPVDGGEPPFLVFAAGNESGKFSSPVPAKYSGAGQWAGLVNNVQHIIVVEALELDLGSNEATKLANYSNIEGDISAPGTAVLSTVNKNAFALLTGSSMAAPHVAGLAAYLLGIDPSLSNAQLKTLLTLDAKPVAPNGAAGANRMDAFSSVLNIDHLTGSFDVTTMLLDIDDGTLDGNQRVLRSDPSTDFIDEDADQDGGMGDGDIDMSDFRRWRDWCHQVNTTGGATFDGSLAHVKFDVNGNGKVEAPAVEETHPRADFNGDGFLNDVSTTAVAGVYRGLGPQTDVDVIALLFDDEHYTPDELYDLVDSGDIHVDASHMFDSGRFTRIVSRVTVNGLFDEREYTETELVHIYTVPSDDTFEVTLAGIDAVGDTLCVHTETFDVGLCQDHYWKPTCSGVVVEITLADVIALGATSPVVVRAGIIQGDGSVVYQSGIDIDVTASGGTIAQRFGTTDSDGFYSTEVTMATNTTQLNVFATASAGGESAVARATAQPPVNNAIKVFTAEWDIVAEASAGIGPNIEQNLDPDSGTFLNAESFSGSVGATAGASNEENSASASVNLSTNGSANWESPGVLSSLSVTTTSNANVTITGPFTEGYAGIARSSLTVEIVINVAGPPDLEANDRAGRFGVQLIVSAIQRSSVTLVRLAGGGNSEVVNSDRTFDLPPGGYKVAIRCGAAAGASPPPSSDSDSGDGQATIRFAELPAASVAGAIPTGTR